MTAQAFDCNDLNGLNLLNCLNAPKEVAMGRVKNLDEIKAMIRERTGKRNTFRHAKREDVESVLANLTSKDPELWAREWSRVAKPYEEEGAKLEQAGKFKEARDAYVQA